MFVCDMRVDMLGDTQEAFLRYCRIPENPGVLLTFPRLHINIVKQ